MTRFFTLRLAASNLRRHHRTYMPFLIASSLLTFAMYAFLLLMNDPGIEQLDTGSITFSLTLILGAFVIVLFTYIFLFYANSFLIRRRKKELGMYVLLGLERHHMIRMMLVELLILLGITLVLGISLGMLLARLLFLMLQALTETAIPLTIGLNGTALLGTCGLMGVLFLLLLGYNALQITRARPVDLLQASHQAEKEPRAQPLLTLIGTGCMIWGYGIALTVSDPIGAVEQFFVAVLLVIIGTYLLFTTGSIAVLKLMQRCRSFYCKPQRFVIVSGMLFRMKQNAVGLASICILLTMTMITFGTTASLYVGKEAIMDQGYPVDMIVHLDHPSDQNALLAALPTLDESLGMTRRDQYALRNYDTIMWRRDQTMLNSEQLNEQQPHVGGTPATPYAVLLMPLEDFHTLQPSDASLAEGTLGWCGEGCPDELIIAGQRWRLTSMNSLQTAFESSSLQQCMLITPDWETAVSIAACYPKHRYEQEEGLQLNYSILFNINGTLTERITYAKAFTTMIPRVLREAHGGQSMGWGYSFQSKPQAEQDWSITFGLFLYVGAFLGMIFLLGTALILYFKQISEGHQDRERYIILQKVGMHQQEVRRSVRRQVLLVFFLPLAVALAHVLVSMKMMQLVMTMFSLLDMSLTTACALLAALIVTCVYLTFYRQTAKAYYQLVRFD